jgi:hypothetical protein
MRMDTLGLYSLIFGIIGFFCFSSIWIGTSAMINDSGEDVRPFWFIVGGACMLAAGILIGGGEKQ